MDAPARKDWIYEQGELAKTDFIFKVTAGQTQHGCDLGEVSIQQLVREARQESLDNLCYNAELGRRISVLLGRVADLESENRELRNKIDEKYGQ